MEAFLGSLGIEMKSFLVFVHILAYGAIAILFLLIGKLIYGAFTRYQLDDQLVQQDNTAVGLSLAGYFVAMVIIFAGVIPRTEVPLKDGLADFAIYGALGIILLNISRLVTDKMILYKFKINKELIDDKNVGTGAVLAGAYIASGLVILACIGGDITADTSVKAFGKSISPVTTGIVMSLIFFVVGQITFVVYSYIYAMTLAYNPHEEVEKDNVAAGISFGGGLIALGLILYRAIHGDGFFHGWIDSLVYYGLLVLFAITIFPLIRFLVDKIMLRGSSLTKEIVEDRNVNAAYIEIICLNAFGAVILLAY